MHYISSNVGFTNIDVWSTGQSGAETKYGVPTVRGHWKFLFIASKNHMAIKLSARLNPSKLSSPSDLIHNI